MLAVRTASAGKIAPFAPLPSRTGQPSHRFFLCSVGAELSSPSSLSNQPNLPCNDPLANHHVRRHFPVGFVFLSNYFPQPIRITACSNIILLTIRRRRDILSSISRRLDRCRCSFTTKSPAPARNLRRSNRQLSSLFPAASRKCSF